MAEKSAREPRRALLLPVVVCSLLALALRVIYLSVGSANPFWRHLGLDLATYDQWARVIAGGHGLGETPFSQAPFFPLVLGLVYALLGPDPVRALWVHLLPGVASVAMVSWGAGLWLGPAAAWTAGILLALYKPAIFFTGVLLPPTWILALSSLFALLMLRLLRPASTSGRQGHALRSRQVFVTGLSLGFLGLAQPTALALVVPGLWALSVIERGRPPRPRGPRAWFLAGTLLPLCATLLYNGIGGGAWSLVSLNGGINAYIGNGPEANGAYVRPPGMREDRDLLGVAAAMTALGRPEVPGSMGTPEQPGGGEANGAVLREANTYWTRKALDYAFAHPVRSLGLYIRKIAFFFGQYEIPQVESLGFEQRYAALLRFPLPGMALLVAFAFLGAFLLSRGGPAAPSPAPWLSGSILSIAAGVSLFFVTARFRLVAAPFLALLGGAGLSCLWSRRARFGPREGVGAGGAAVLFLLLNLNLTGIRKDAGDGQYHFRVGVICEQEKKPAEAMQEYEQALTLDPTLGKAEVNLGTLYARQGRRAEARLHLERGVSLDSLSAVGYLNLGQLNQLEGRPEEALADYGKAIEHDPTTVSARESAALLLYEGGRVDEARPLLEAVQLMAPGGSPPNLRARSLLQILSERAALSGTGWRQCRLLLQGDLRLVQGDRAGAAALYRQAAADPQGAEAARRMLDRL